MGWCIMNFERQRKPATVDDGMAGDLLSAVLMLKLQMLSLPCHEITRSDMPFA